MFSSANGWVFPIITALTALNLTDLWLQRHVWTELPLQVEGEPASGKFGPTAPAHYRQTYQYVDTTEAKF